ncbi:hypothetical protein HMPREF9123_1504 [Neisseria bacilliformis ATCC BAA-1200]|uniref:Uncharacterized protein n=1 Tax=Neisseria bacilliformis ATCC BAA-1200 TaxID=888742 RepID=F2BCL6_9NEIS|nr:hypothetical protein HMPREF9123_1504 [Neisseria bacilliformis ATCC BAA-1200]
MLKKAHDRGLARAVQVRFAPGFIAGGYIGAGRLALRPSENGFKAECAAPVTHAFFVAQAF